MLDRRALIRIPLLEVSPLSRHRAIRDEVRVRHEHALFVSEEIGVEIASYAFVFGPLSVRELLNSTGEVFSGRSFDVIVESDGAPGLEAHLISEGWTCVEEEIGMILTESVEIPPALESLRIEPVTDDRTYADYMDVVPGNRHWVPNLEAATDPRVGLFVGYADSQPVATSRLTCFGEVAELTAIQTLPGYRRRGYGRAMTWSAIAEAQRRGCTIFTLTSTEMGLPLYLSMGFEDICAYRTFARTGDA